MDISNFHTTFCEQTVQKLNHFFKPYLHPDNFFFLTAGRYRDKNIEQVGDSAEKVLCRIKNKVIFNSRIAVPPLEAIWKQSG